MKKVKHWTASPAKRMSFAAVGDPPLVSWDPIKDAPVICATVHTTSEVMKIHKIL